MFTPHFFPQCSGFSPDPLPLCSSGPLPTQLCSMADMLPVTGSLCHVFISLDLGNAYCVLFSPPVKMSHEFSRCPWTDQQSASFLSAPCQDNHQVLLLWHLVFILADDICTLSSFAQTLVREIVTYGVMFASVFEGHVNMRQELDCKSDVTRNNVENKWSSGKTNPSSDVNKIIFSMGVWLLCCAS